MKRVVLFGAGQIGAMVSRLMGAEYRISCFMGSYQNYHVKVGNTLVKLEEHNPKNKKIYQVGDRCALVFDPRSVHVL